MAPTSNNKDNVTSWIIRIGSFVMSIAIMISSWFLNQAWNRINTNEQAIRKLELSAAEGSGNRFSAKDWTLAKTLLDSDRLSMDRRLIRLEESLPVIKDTLLEIKQDIKNEK